MEDHFIAKDIVAIPFCRRNLRKMIFQFFISKIVNFNTVNGGEPITLNH